LGEIHASPPAADIFDPNAIGYAAAAASADPDPDPDPFFHSTLP
jgi:hypothetical protein